MSTRKPRLDRASYQYGLRDKATSEIEFIIQDASEATALRPKGCRAEHYGIEIEYCEAELKRRQES